MARVRSHHPGPVALRETVRWVVTHRDGSYLEALVLSDRSRGGPVPDRSRGGPVPDRASNDDLAGVYLVAFADGSEPSDDELTELAWSATRIVRWGMVNEVPSTH